MAVLVIAWKDLPRWDVDGQELCREGKKKILLTGGAVHGSLCLYRGQTNF